MSFLFGAFQALMPVIGWAVGAQFAEAISAWDHWLAFVLLGGIGAKMLHEAYTHRHPGTEAARKADEASTGRNPFHPGRLVVMAFATSIDALAAGVTLPALGVDIVTAAAIIGGVTFVLCFMGTGAARRLGAALEGKLDVVGGVVLIGLGVKTLVEHLTAG